MFRIVELCVPPPGVYILAPCRMSCMLASVCGGSEPARIFGPACDLQQESGKKTYLSDHGTENSDDYSLPLLGLVTLNYNEECVSHKDSDPVEKLCEDKAVNSIPYTYTLESTQEGNHLVAKICGKGFSENSDLKRHAISHRGETIHICAL